MKQIVYVLNGEKYKAQVMGVGSEIWLHVNGETWLIDTAKKLTKSGGAKSKSESTGELFAPMPGKILKVNFSNTERVEEKQTVLIMEAMKMEYSLIAPHTGVLKNLNCKAGDQVELNQLLAVIEKG